MFFNNETVLAKESLLRHFSREHRKIFADKNIEYKCKKGNINTHNQDNFFAVVDGDLKIFGVFDGHGIYGHLVSGFAAGTMLDYIRNHNKAFLLKNIEKLENECLDDPIKDKLANEKMTRALKKCFKYTQRKLKEYYKKVL